MATAHTRRSLLDLVHDKVTRAFAGGSLSSDAETQRIPFIGTWPGPARFGSCLSTCHSRATMWAHERRFLSRCHIAAPETKVQSRPEESPRIMNLNNDEHIKNVYIVEPLGSAA